MHTDYWLMKIGAKTLLDMQYIVFLTIPVVSTWDWEINCNKLFLFLQKSLCISIVIEVVFDTTSLKLMKSEPLCVRCIDYSLLLWNFIFFCQMKQFSKSCSMPLLIRKAFAVLTFQAIIKKYFGYKSYWCKWIVYYASNALSLWSVDTISSLHFALATLNRSSELLNEIC